MITVIDYGVGNIKSVQKAFTKMGIKSIISTESQKIEEATKLVLPGVGNFGDVMQELRKLGFDKILITKIQEETPFLGICVGMQILFETSSEAEGINGLGIFRGRVQKFTQGKIPHIGWNEIIPRKSRVLKKGYVYFANSFYVVPKDDSIISAETDYFVRFPSAIEKDKITAFQFHPEKSGIFGLNILKRWAKC